MQKYRLLGKIGSGAYSIVYKALQLRSGEIVALKQIQIPADDKMQNRVFGREIKTLQELNGHPNIINLLEIFRKGDKIYLVFEFIPMDLITFYKTVKEKEKRNLNDSEITYIFRQVCAGLQFMHSKRIIHRDLKPENILIDPKNLKVKLIDFGFAKVLNERQNTQYIVTRWYRPIQVVLGLPYDSKVDIFSIGALLLQLYSGKQVFRSASNIDQLYWICFICGYPYWQPALDKIKQLNLKIENQGGAIIKNLIKNIRPEGQALILQMLKITPHHRPSIFQVMENPYFHSQNRPVEGGSSQLKLNRKLISETDKRKSEYVKTNKNITENVLGQKNQTNKYDQTKQKKIQPRKTQRNTSSLLKSKQTANNIQSATKIVKFNVPSVQQTVKTQKQINKQDKKIQISALVTANRHKRNKSNQQMLVNPLTTARLNSKHHQISTYQSTASKLPKPTDNLHLKKLHRMSNY